MPNKNFSLAEQANILAAAIYYNSTEINWKDFTLDTDQIIKIITDINNDDKFIYYLDNYAFHMFKHINYDSQLKLVKKRIEYFYCCPLDGRYNLGSFKLIDREELLTIAIKNCIKNNKVYIFDLAFFNLPFKNTIDIALQYPAAFTSILNYLNKFDSMTFYVVKKNIILKLLTITDRQIRVEDCIFLLEHHRIEILNTLSITTPQQVINNIKNFKVSDPLVRLKILTNTMNSSLDLHGFMMDFVKFQLFRIPGIIGKLTVALEATLAANINWEFDLIHAEFMQLKIFNNNTLWNDENQVIFEKELNFLRKYEIIDEFSGSKFLNIANWLVYTVVLFNVLDINNELKNNIEVIHKLLKEIRSFSDPEMRFSLVKFGFNKLFTQSVICQSFCDFIRNKSQTLLLPSLVMMSYMSEQEIFNDIIEVNVVLAKIYSNNKKYKDGKHMRSLIFGMQAIFSQNYLDIQKKFLLINKILSCNFIEQKNGWWLIQSVFELTKNNLQEFTILYRIIMEYDINVASKKIFMRIFQINDHKLISNYEHSLGSRHNQTALLIYYTKMQLLPEHKKLIMLEVLDKYVHSILSDHFMDYYALRYNVNHNPQLKIIFAHYPALEFKWRTNYMEDYSIFIQENELIIENEIHFNLVEFLIDRIIKYRHLPLGYREYFQAYVDLHQKSLPGNEDKKLAIELQLQQQLNLMSSGYIVEPNVISYQLQLALIEIIKNNPIDPQKQFLCLMEINRYIPININSEFFNDLYYAARKLLSSFFGNKITCIGWRVVDTDDYWSMFMAGTDIEGSCLRVDGKPELNKYLMGNVINGDCRMLAIQNAEGITLARCIVRLLWDAIEKIACIFVEETHPYYITNIQEQVLHALAIRKAAYLNLILVNLEGKMDLINYHNPLVRLEGGNAPFVYSDSNINDEEQVPSVIKVMNAKILFDYSKTKLTKQQQLNEAASKYKLNVYQKGVFFTPSKYATCKQPYGPYADHYCFSGDPLTNITKEYTMLLKLGM